MTSLDRKLLRDLIHMRGQVIAIVLIIASAIATFVTMRGAYESLLASRDSFYSIGRFADVFVDLKRAPESVGTRLATLRGVSAIQTRVVAPVVLDVPGLGEPASGFIQSLPERGTPALNDVYVRTGRRPEAGAGSSRGDEVIASEAFAAANRLAIGSTIYAVINGKWTPLRIVGTGISPEFIHEHRGGGFPDHRRFGVLWMARRPLAAAYGMTGAFNNVVFSLSGSASEKDVIAAIDQALEPYGGRGAIPRRDQFSHSAISSEIAQTAVTANVLPAIFLGVAAFLIHLVLSRLVTSQREQIAVLKAFGYTPWRVARHYLQFSLTLVALGGVAGVPVGLWLGMKLTGVYTAFFHFPQLVFRTSPMAIVVSLGVTALAAVAAAIGAVRAVVALPPAEGMRGETPLRFRRGLVERIGAPRLLSPAVRMLLRNLERRPIRALLSIVAIAMAVAILVVTLFSFDALESVIAIQFRMAQNDDVQLSLQTPAARGALTSLRSLPGVLRMEPVRTVLVKVSSRQRMRRVPLIGMERSNELRRIVDARGHVAELPAGGLLLTVKLAEVLGVTTGDIVTVEAIEGSRPQARMQVAATVEEMIGMSAYASREDVNAFLREGDVVSGAWLAIDGASASELYRRLKKMPGIATVELREVMLQSFRDTIEKNNTMTVSVVALFACIVAFGMVYNSSRIALSERGRDLATLRVLGFSSREVGVMLVGEQAILTALGIPLGFAFGYGLAWAVAKLYDSEQFRIPLVLSGRTFAFAFAVVAASAAISALLVQRRVASLDLVEVLKTRE